MAFKELLPAKEEVSDTVDYKYGVARVTVLRDPGVGDSEVNWKHWLTLPKWTPEQAVWLLYKIDPNAVLQPLLPLPLPLQELLQHAKLRGDMSPHQWKQFGVEQELQWSMPRQLREIQEPVIEAVNVKLLSEGLNKHLSHLEIVSLWIDTKEHRHVTNHDRETIHQAFLDEESVQYDENLTKAIKDNHELKDRHLKAINQAIADGDLKAEISVSHSGRVGSWEVISYSPTMLHGVQGDTGVYQGREVYVQHMINRDDFRAWLEKTHQWPISNNCSLAQWFETELQTETMEIISADNQATMDSASTKPIQANDNDFEFSRLLNPPAKKDAWFDVINDMTQAFYRQFKKTPNETQAWSQLWVTPPFGYNITTGKDKGGEDCLNMPGTKPLSNSAFKKRWAGYTTDKS